ncbi:hypothetical protein MKX73_19175 [Solibacillus sp. FSL W7-1436]|uniref:hypothetical protein n=1 Tax=Solibacillus sp. FSL W7-1436 TaxID=2921705 RepID=UPI0030FA7761
MTKKPKNGISLRIDNQPLERQERLNEWLNAQSNNTQSIFNLIDHMIDRFGYTDVTSHEINKKLYLERITYEQTGIPIAPTAQPQTTTHAHTPVEDAAQSVPEVSEEAGSTNDDAHKDSGENPQTSVSNDSKPQPTTRKNIDLNAF